jgi:hypothetical protein
MVGSFVKRKKKVGRKTAVNQAKKRKKNNRNIMVKEK